jgi:transcriptional activator SPT7
MKRVRHTHAKFTALNLSSSNNEDAEGGLSDIPGIGSSVGEEEGMGIDDDKVDETPWSLKGKGKVKGIEMGEENATDCVRWMGGKVLEHAGFQGLSCFVS